MPGYSGQTAVITRLFILIVRAYQVVVSPILPSNTCRFHPTCSQYAIDSMTKYGAFRGSWRAAKRIGKCHPLHPGGYDPA